jgi:protein-disulfide isomerase
MGVPSGELAAALKSKSIRLRLKHDIAVGIDLGVTGTPGFMIDGKVYTGTIPKEVLKKIKSFNG